MLLKNVYIRFYKSFNFDYLRKYKAATDKYPWENLDNSWYPFVRIPIEHTVTTVVGANESGKSHLRPRDLDRKNPAKRLWGSME